MVCNAFAQSPELPVEAYAKLPEILNPIISPDGKYLAARRKVNGIHHLVISKILSAEDNTPEKPMIIGRQGDFDIFSYEWANNDRLILTLDSLKQGRLFSRLVSVDRKGSDPVYFDMDRNLQSGYRQIAMVVDLLEHDDEHILAVLDEKAHNRPIISRLNVYTGEKQVIEDNKIGFNRFYADHNGILRLGLKLDTRQSKNEFISTRTLYYRESEASEWQLLQKIDAKDPNRLAPYRFDRTDPNILIIMSWPPGSDPDDREAKFDTHRYDLTKREITGRHEEPAEKEILELVSKAIPGSTVDFISATRDYRRTIVFAYSDIINPAYYIVDTRLNRIDKLGPIYPELESITTVPMEEINYTARDGLPIHAYLSRPPNSGDKKLPVIVSVHDGPASRVYKRFDPWTQMLVARGYAVFHPNFRGSLGYGIKHRDAGNLQWGYAIQDDITDGVRWLIDQGIADPELICIEGNGFGGYAVSIGLIKTPELYRCGISMDGIHDLQQYIEKDRGFVDPRFWAEWNDKAKAVSPYHHAKSLNLPMLITANEHNENVRVSQSRKMYKRLAGMKKEVEYIEFSDVTRYTIDEKTNIEIFKAAEQFFARHLGPNVE